MPGTWPLVGRDEELALIADALRDSTTCCVVLSGRAGVGKTRLAREAVHRAEAERWSTRWAIATEQAREIPLGTIAPLLPREVPESAGSDRFVLLRWAYRCLLEGRPHRDLLALDDAPLLDSVTAALVQQLVRAQTGPRMLLTARSTDMPEWLTGLTRDDHVQHIRIQELSESDMGVLLERVLDGSADAATHALLWAHSSGNPLWLRQLVAHGTDGGALQRRDDVFRWDGPIGSGDLDQLLATRIERIPPVEAQALELVALGEPLPAQAAAALGIRPQLEALERRELIEQDPASRVRMAHPLYGSVTRARIGALARSAAERRLADAFCTQGVPAGPDALRVARWRLDSGDISDAALMATAAHRALLLDAGLAERFARAACTAEPGYASLHVLGRSLFDQLRTDEAEQIYRRLLDGPLAVEERLGVTLEMAMGHAWGSYDVDGAIAELRVAECEPAFAPYRALIAGMRAAVELFRGELAATLRAAGSIATDPGEDVRVRYLAALAVIPALTLTGQVTRALELAGWARAAAPEQDFSGSVPYAPTYAVAQLEWEYALALRWGARVDDAVAAATTALQRAAREPHQHTQSYGLLNAAAGAALLAAGNVRDARGALRVGASALRESDVNGSVLACLADLSCAEALAGNPEFAGELLAEAAARTSPATRLFDAPQRRARAVVAAMTGDRAGALAEARAGAAQARASGQPVVEAGCLHLLVRLDEPRAGCERLTELAEAVDAKLVSIFAAHAVAAVRDDPSELEQVAERFGAAGARMLAAHAAAAAARTYRRAGRPAAANRAAGRSRAYSAGCPDAPAPLLLVEPVPLTPRERSIVELARRGQSNAQIAEALTLSVRTVESHLQHAYRKLGVQGRTDLIAAPEG